MTKQWSSNEFYDYIIYKANLDYSSVTVKKVYNAIVMVVLEQMMKDGEIQLPRLGTFRSTFRSGKDYSRYDFSLGESRKYFVENRRSLSFSCDKNLVAVANNNLETNEARLMAKQLEEHMALKDKDRASKNYENLVVAPSTLDIIESKIILKKNKQARKLLREQESEQKENGESEQEREV